MYNLLSQIAVLVNSVILMVLVIGLCRIIRRLSELVWTLELIVRNIEEKESSPKSGGISHETGKDEDVGG